MNLNINSHFYNFVDIGDFVDFHVGNWNDYATKHVVVQNHVSTMTMTDQHVQPKQLHRQECQDEPSLPIIKWLVSKPSYTSVAQLHQAHVDRLTRVIPTGTLM